jgi:hypothetical protein
MRFPNDTTIIAHFNGGKDAEGTAKSLEQLFDDDPNSYDWASAWQAVDGGLITLLFDNSKVGWLDLPDEKKDWPADTWPLAEKTKYVSIGFDWTEKNNCTGFQLHSTCADQDSTQQVQLAMRALLSAYEKACLAEEGDAALKYRALLERFFSSVSIRPSNDAATEPFVHATAEVSWGAQQFIEIICDAWEYLANLPPG